jgi:hypothetical protein
MAYKGYLAEELKNGFSGSALLSFNRQIQIIYIIKDLSYMRHVVPIKPVTESGFSITTR